MFHTGLCVTLATSGDAYADGVGYSLTAVKEAGCNSVVVQDVIHRHVPDATTLSNVGAEISFQLPLRESCMPDAVARFIVARARRS